MIRIGIECESIEDQTWGVGRIVKKLLEEMDKRPELQKEFRFFLYFKSRIPDYPWLTNPIFVKKIIFIHSQILKNLRMNSFSLYYYVFLPIKLWFERLDMMFFPNYMLPIIFRGKSLVTLTEDIYYEINIGTLPFRYKLAYKIFAGWWAAKHATKIMAVSNSSKQELVRLFKINQDRIFINPLGIDPPKQNYKLQMTNDKQIQNTKYKIQNPYVLYIGQAFPRRHLKETMLAFEIIAPQFHDLKLIAIGKDKYNPPILLKLKDGINSRLGRTAIIYKDYVPEEELAALMANTKLLIYPSSKEAFGLPPLEALAYGIPPIVADQPITREIFGNNAFFVQNQDSPESIADAIRKGLENMEERKTIVNAAPDILKKYTWPNFADRFLNHCRLMAGHELKR